MTNISFSFDYERFNKLFPFHLLIDDELRIQSSGRSLSKICPVEPFRLFTSLFRLSRPVMPDPGFQDLVGLSDQLVIIGTTGDREILFRGQFEPLPDQKSVVFIGSPWFATMDHIRKEDLTIHDFAIHDPMIDLLHVIKTQELVSSDLKFLLKTVNRQKEELKKAGREIHHIALFPMQSPDPLIRIDKAGNILFRNPMAETLTEFEYNGILTDATTFWKKITSGIDLNAEMWSFEAISCGKTYSFVCKYIDSEEYINIYGRDITIKKEVQNRIKESEGRLSNLIKNIKEGILLEDENRKIVWINRCFCEMFSIPLEPDDMMGMDCSDAAEQTKHLFKNQELFVDRIDAILREKQTVLAEELELADNRFYLRDYVPIFVQDQFKGNLWKYADITSRKRYERNLKNQEEKFRNIIANMQLGIVEVDAEDSIRYVNQNFCKISGYNEDDLIGKKTIDFSMYDKNREIIEAKNKLRERGISDYYEIQVESKEGENRWWLISGAPNYDDRGNFTGSIGIHLDITQQKNLEKELVKAKLDAEGSSRAKENFLANMSHEIRTPLNAIIGMVRELSRETLSLKQNQLLNNARTAAEHLLSIINNVLDISKIEAGLLQLDERHFSLKEIIEDTCRIMTTDAAEKLITLNTHVSDKIKPALIGDPARIRQILINVVGNSVKFTQKGTILIDSAVEETSDESQKICITVSDTGEGMNEEFIKDLFKKFSQEDISISRKYGGTGLGMAITYELVQLMNGTIEVTSEKNKGTKFEILLPFKLGEPEKIESEKRREGIDQLKNIRVLLAEDNQINRLVATNTLKNYGMKVTETENGKDALEKLKTEAFDVILMDLQMPVMDGIEATRIIRKELKLATPIIALTANAFRKELDICLASGMNDYVIKPFEENTLIRSILKNTNDMSNINQEDLNPHLPIEKPDDSEKKLYNLEKLNAFSRGDNSFIRKMARLFIDQTPVSLQKIRESLSSGDYETIKTIAHRIRPSIENMGILSVVDDIRTIEQLAANDPASELLPDLIQKINEILEKAIAQLVTDFPEE